MWFAYTVLPIVCTSASVLGPPALQLGLTLDKNREKKKKHFVQSEFLTCHILAWPLGQFYKTEVGRKVYFPAD